MRRKVVFSGDVLLGKHRRTDLIGGNFEELVDGIHNKLFTMPDSTKIYPGHGPKLLLVMKK